MTSGGTAAPHIRESADDLEAVQVTHSQAGEEIEAASNLALPWVVRLRYGLVLGAAAGLGGIAYLRGSHLAFLWTIIPLAAVLATNVWLHRVSLGSVRSPQATLGIIFTFDTLCLTAVLGLTDGPMNPFSLLYLVQITLAAVVLRKEWTWVLTGLSAVCFGLLFFLPIPFTGFHMVSAEHSILPHLVGMWIAFVIAAALIGFFTGRVSNALRLREQQVLALQGRIARQERLASLVTLAAGAAHELGTPLGTIAVIARELERYASTLTNGSDLSDDARLIRSEVERCQSILQRMSAEGAEPIGESPRNIAVGELLCKALEEVSETRRSQVTLDPGEPDAIIFLPVQATVQSLTALIGNALDAGSGNVRVVLRAQRRASEIMFSVCDNGCGMSGEILRRIAEPFFTTKEPGKGMGLGTFLVRTFAERLGGRLSYESIPGQGTTATLTLPVQLSKRGAAGHATT